MIIFPIKFNFPFLTNLIQLFEVFPIKLDLYLCHLYIFLNFPITIF